MRVRDITARAKVTGRQRGSVIFFLCWDLVPALNWTTSVMSSCRGRWCRDITDVEGRAGEQEGGEGGRTGSLVSPVSQVINNSSTNGISLSRRHPEAQSRPFTLFSLPPSPCPFTHTFMFYCPFYLSNDCVVVNDIRHELSALYTKPVTLVSSNISRLISGWDSGGGRSYGDVVTLTVPWFKIATAGVSYLPETKEQLRLLSSSGVSSPEPPPPQLCFPLSLPHPCTP